VFQQLFPSSGNGIKNTVWIQKDFAVIMNFPVTATRKRTVASSKSVQFFELGGRMSAYLIGHITVKDQSQWQIYVDGVKESLAPFNAEIIFRGKRDSVLAGQHPYQQTVVIRFTDQAELQNWFHSERYQALIPIRDRAADVVIVSYSS
jgi:uncharacterized protein (DUF1330 family)